MRYPFLIIFALIAIPCLSHTVLAQDGYVPPDSVPVTLSDGTVLEATYWDFGYNIDLIGDDFSINVSFENGPELSISINNSDSPYDWSQGVIEIRTGYGAMASDEVVDPGILPREYRELWVTLQEVCGELAENDGFWEILDDLDDNDKANIMENLEQMRDGYYAPDVHDWLLFCQSYIGGWSDDRPSRGYHLKGPVDFSISTQSPWGDENPEIDLEISGRMPEDRCAIHIDPVTELCTISWEAVEYIPGPDREDWMPYINEFRIGLDFYRDRIPSLVDAGVLDPENEFEFLLERAMEGLDTYDFVLEYPMEKPLPSFFN